jgi:Flp pilus assembly protein TadG
MNGPTSRRRNERGVSAVEFAVIGPVFILLVFLIIEAGLYFYGRNAALSAAREGVSFLRVAGTDSDPNSFEPVAADLARQYAERLGNLHGVTARAVISDDGRVQVDVSGTIDLPLGSYDVSQSAQATLEQFNRDPALNP